MKVEEIILQDALEQIAENDKYIQSLKQRIDELEFHLFKCREASFKMYNATVGVIENEWRFDAEAVAKKTRPRKHKSDGK